MELTFAWFWIINLIFIAINFLILIKAYKFGKANNKFLNKWFWLFIILAIINIVMPIKINGTNSSEVLKQQAYSIQQTKVLPKKVQDNSFKEGLKQSTATVTHDEIWNK